MYQYSYNENGEPIGEDGRTDGEREMAAILRQGSLSEADKKMIKTQIIEYFEKQRSK